ncbi:MAG: 50S ribosomal protein L6 [Verrucomicrobia bacterium]|jgi:large subunit ribosomal protein L6|nr:50S ribosomal protein L6 [Verrucomicrobiota bacterium]
MSRIGEMPIDVPAGVTIAVEGSHVTAKGGKGELALDLPEGISADLEGSTLNVARSSDDQKAYHGLSRSLIANMIEGVNNGYSKELEIQGVGFKAALQGSTLSLSLGFASPVEYTVPDTVDVTVNNNTAVVVSGADKQQVGEVASRIRSFYPAEPYKGKGVRYKGEHVRRKEGKTVA